MPILSLQALSENKCDICNFVFKTQNDLEEHIRISKNCSSVSRIISQERTFNYNLTTTKAKSNLLKSARRDPYEIIHHLKCVKILFNAGLYKVVLLPLLSAFQNLEPSGPLTANILKIKLVSLVPGKDISGNVVDTKIELDVNNKKVTLHAYNTTQNGKVEGAGYLILVEDFLEPLLSQKSKEFEAEVEDINNDIIDKFGQENHKLKNVGTWKDGMSKNFICSVCDFVTTNKIGLKTHITRKHVKEGRHTNKSITYTNSSKINQINDPELLMIEDTSITNIEDIEEEIGGKIEAKNSVEDQKATETQVDEHINDRVVSISSDTRPDVLIEDCTFYCSICAKSFELRENLEVHFNNKHGNSLVGKEKSQDRVSLSQNIFVQNKPEENKEEANTKMMKDFQCKKCSKIIRTETGVKRHLEIYCEECQKCSPERTSFNIHNVVYHENSCAHCNLKFNSIPNLERHIETEHAIGNNILCNVCGKMFMSMSTLNSHVQTDHTKPINIETFPCEKCGLVLATFTLHQEHIKSHHKPGGSFQCRFCDYFTENEDYVVLHSMAKQVENINDKMADYEQNKSETNHLLKNILTNQNIIMQELFLVRNKLEMKNTPQSDNPPPESLRNPPQQTQRQTPPSPAPLQPSSTPTRHSSPLPQPPPVRKTVDNPKSKSPTNHPKTLFIGDSISANVNIEALEEATQTEFITAKAYCSVYDDVTNVAKQSAKFPSSNFTDVIPMELKKNNYKTMILQAGSVDITNLNTKDEPEKYIEYFRQEAVMSATNLFSAAVNALIANPTLTKIILLKQTPRYDPLHVDPLGLKPTLSVLFNNTLTDLWMKSLYKDNIFVGAHNIECTGAIKEARYRHTKSGKYDGIHLFGSSGQKAYTLSVLNILRAAKITTPEHDYHLSCPQYRYQTRKTQNHRNHKYEPRRHTMKEHAFHIPTFNRFSRLDTAQGNW